MNTRKATFIVMLLLCATPQPARAAPLPSQITDVLSFANRNYAYFQNLTTMEGLSEQIFGGLTLEDLKTDLIQNLADMGFNAIGFDPSAFVDGLQDNINEFRMAIAKARNEIYRQLTFAKSYADSDLAVAPDLDQKKFTALGDKADALTQQQNQIKIFKDQGEMQKRVQENLETNEDNVKKTVGEFDKVTHAPITPGSSEMFTEAAKNATSTREVTQILVGVAAEQLNQQALNSRSVLQMLAEQAKQQTITNQQLGLLINEEIKTNMAQANAALREVQDRRGQAQAKAREVYNMFGELNKAMNGLYTEPAYK